MANGRTVNAFLSLRLPPPLVEALVALQREQRERVDPQDCGRMENLRTEGEGDPDLELSRRPLRQLVGRGNLTSV